MDASRELDALIAEKIMGWKRTKLSYQLAINYDRLQICPGIDNHFPIEPPEFFETPEDGRDRKHFYSPKYSTDLSAAWEVVEKIGVRFCLIKEETSGNYTHPYKAWFTGFSVAYGTSPAHAICLAALKVMKRE